MTKVFFTSQISWWGKRTPRGLATLLDTGSDNCYIDVRLAQDFNWSTKRLGRSRIGFGGSMRRRYGPFYPTFTVVFRKRSYTTKGRTYIMRLPPEFSVLLSGNWIQNTGLPVEKLVRHHEKYDY